MTGGAGMRLSRREFVVIGANVVAGGVALEVVACTHGGSKSGPAKDFTLPASFTDIDSMRLVGHKYLDLHPEESMDLLLSELAPERGYAALEAEIRRQFASGDVVRVAGWVLAKTEARIYAVVSLRP